MANKVLDVSRHVFSFFLTLGALALIFYAIGAGHAALPGERKSGQNVVSSLSFQISAPHLTVDVDVRPSGH